MSRGRFIPVVSSCLLLALVTANLYVAVKASAQGDPILQQAPTMAASCAGPADCPAGQLCWCPAGSGANPASVCQFVGMSPQNQPASCVNSSNNPIGACVTTHACDNPRAPSNGLCAAGQVCACNVPPPPPLPNQPPCLDSDGFKVGGICIDSSSTVGCPRFPTQTPTPTPADTVSPVPTVPTWTPTATPIATPTNEPTSTPTSACNSTFQARLASCSNDYTDGMNACHAACNSDYDYCLHHGGILGTPCPNPNVGLCPLLCWYWYRQCYYDTGCADGVASLYKQCYCGASVQYLQCIGHSATSDDFSSCLSTVSLPD